MATPIIPTTSLKFRPYLTAPELLRILGALKKESPPALGLIKYLETFAIKIEKGITTPAYTLEPTIEQKLGLVQESSSNSTSIQVLVHDYELFPSDRAKYSPAELERIQSFRYTAGRMSPEEESEYEKTLGL